MNFQTLKIFGIIQMLFSAAIFIALGQAEVLKLNNENNFIIGVYDDSSVNGNSTIKELSDGDFEFSVGNQYEYGFSGVYIQKEDKSLFEIGEGKVLELVLNSESDVDIQVSFEKLISDGKSTRRFHAKSSLRFNKKKNSHQVNLNEFQTPEWWSKKNNKKKMISLLDSLVSFKIEFKKSGDKLQSGTIGIDEVSILTEGNSLQLPVGAGLFFVGLILMLIPQKGGANGSNQPKDNKENPIVYYVNSNLYSRSLSIDSVSEHFKLSTDYISQRMKTETGLDYKDYVNKKRVEKAKELLKLSDDKVSDIAKLCGFKSSLEFSETFKSLTGTIPNEYRNSISD
mgnify:CR=1 FL=1|tara:strand:- start:734 stop:1753 length:1020 start_codon:yes stop_codon:yes gene_type:complete